MGLVKLGRCGDTVWTLPRMVHHAISPDDDGGFWVASKHYVAGASPYPHVSPPFYDETAMKVSAAGTVVSEVSILASLMRDRPGAFFGNATFDIPNGDMIHVNDVEALPAAFADRFPMFAPGDLLVSLRGLSMLLALRPSTGRVTWTSVGPWIRQHDPDFLPNGHISAFSNNTLDVGERVVGGDVPDPLGTSTIVDLDPATGATRVSYGDAPGRQFYSAYRGKHQALDNGNLLIVESNAGRAFEVASDGELVWEFVNHYDERDNAVVYQARRYADDYFTVSDWTCPAAR
jgi:hypothetical protein